MLPTKKRNKNHLIGKYLVHGVSQRGSARIVNVNRKTVSRKLEFLAKLGNQALEKLNQLSKPATDVQFDDLETCCVSKKMEALRNHIAVYVAYHNRLLQLRGKF